MIDKNGGYVGYSRSRRSAEAIQNFEVPLSHIKKDLIETFLKERKEELLEDYSKDAVERLETIPVEVWKFVADKIVGPSSWHHTSSWLNETWHYDLMSVAMTIAEDIEGVLEKFNEFKKKKEEEKSKLVWAVAEVAVWDRRGRWTRYLGTEKIAGIKKGDWLYYKEGSRIRKLNLFANKVKSREYFGSLDRLFKANPEFKDKRSELEALIDEVK